MEPGDPLKRILVLLGIVLVFAFMQVSPVQALTEPLWIDGQITSSTILVDQMYDGNHFSEFNLTIADTNNTALVAIGQEITVVCWTAISTDFVVGGFYNLTGAVVDVQVGEVPQGYFVVSVVNVGELDWLDAIFAILEQVGGWVSGIAYWAAGMVFEWTGIVIPEIAITALLVGLCFFFIIKNAKTLGITLVLVLVFLLVSGSANLLRLVWLGLI